MSSGMSPISSKPLKAGDVVIETKPLIHCIGISFKGKLCDNCLNSSDALKKCSQCLQMSYCDKSCQLIDWKYHSSECKALKSLKHLIDKKAIHSKHISAKELLLLRLWLNVKHRKGFATKRHQTFGGSTVRLNQIEVNLEVLAEEYPSLVDIEFDHICRHFEAYGLKFERKELLHWFGLLISGRMSVSTTTVRDDLMICKVAGLYPELHSIRHSCQPNTAIIRSGLSVELRAMKSIGADEEITFSYIELNQSRAQRQALLRIYSIDCNCDKCEQNLDSGVDYEQYNQLVQSLQGFAFHELSVKPIEMSEFWTILSNDDIIYGKEVDSPERTKHLAELSVVCLHTQPVLDEIHRQLMDQFENAFEVTTSQEMIDYLYSITFF